MTLKTLNKALLLLIAAGALYLRGVNLAERPMHNDEANQAYKCGQLLEFGEYAYDPADHHGPTLYYFTLPVAWLSGTSTFAETSEHTFRIVPVLFGVGVILLLWLLADGIGWGAVLVAGLLTAVSPAMVFYSGFYVQEMLLVFFTLATLVCGWRYAKCHCWGWAIGCGLSVGLMHATKETCVLGYAAMAGALAVLALTDSKFRRGTLRSVQPVHVVVALCCAAVVSVLLFSSFLTQARGPLDSILTYLNYLARAGGAEHHQHPSPFYYIRMLAWTRYPGGTVWTEGAALALALVGGVVAWRGTKKMAGNSRADHGPTIEAPVHLAGSLRMSSVDSGRTSNIERPTSNAERRNVSASVTAPWHKTRCFLSSSGLRRCAFSPAAAGMFVPVLPREQRFSRFLSVYAVLLLLVYSLIPYKTPWCMLSFLHALIVLAGVGAQSLFRLCRPVWGRVAIAVVLAGAVAHLGVQARRATGRYRADPRNPYVYAHTSTDFMKLVRRIEDVQACHDAGRSLSIHVIAPADEQWPLPFYLRRYPNVGFWPNPDGAVSDTPPVVIASLQFEEAVRERLGNAYMTEFYGLRPEVLLSLWIRRDLWEQFMETRR